MHVQPRSVCYSPSKHLCQAKQLNKQQNTLLSSSPYSFPETKDSDLSKRIVQFHDCICENDCYAPAVDEFIQLLDSELECGDDWLGLSRDALETIMAFATRCLRSHKTSVRFRRGIDYLGYCIDVLEYTSSKTMAKVLAKSLANWAYRRDSSVDLLRLLRRLEKIKAHSRTTWTCCEASLHFGVRGNTRSASTCKSTSTCASMNTNKVSTAVQTVRTQSLEREVQTDSSHQFGFAEKSTCIDENLALNTTVRRLREEIAHLKNSNRYGDLLMKLHAA